MADRPNIGLCLDTFQIAAGEWGDPTTTSGMIEEYEPEVLQKQLRQSLESLARTVPADKIYVLQIFVANKPPVPLEKAIDKNTLSPRARWSHNFRPYPYHGGFLPVAAVTKAVLKTGFRAWFSMEVFDGGSDGKGRTLRF